MHYLLISVSLLKCVYNIGGLRIKDSRVNASKVPQTNSVQSARPEPTIHTQKRALGNTPRKLGAIVAHATPEKVKKPVKQQQHTPSPEQIADESIQDKPGVSEKQKLARDHKIEEIIAESNEVLVQAKTVFPFTLFPDTVVVDRLKVTITRNDFFFSREVVSIRLDDLLTVTATTGPLFGSINISSRVLTEDHFVISNLWRKDVIYLKHIIQGYIIANQNKVDCAHLSKPELLDTLAKLGQDSNP